ncbi:hypothetical protein BC829DRAFT_439034 [Chytridium lagenaria]|nr:hypothetical protein BC829DRAFT_439034 [Chytridium lagenaria]
MLASQTRLSALTNWQSEYQRQFTWRDLKQTPDVRKPTSPRPGEPELPKRDHNGWVTENKRTQGWGNDTGAGLFKEAARQSDSERPKSRDLRTDFESRHQREASDDSGERYDQDDEEDYVSRNETRGKKPGVSFDFNKIGAAENSRKQPEITYAYGKQQQKNTENSSYGKQPSKASDMAVYGKSQKTPDIIPYGGGNVNPASDDLYMKTFNTTAPTSEQIYPNTVQKINRSKPFNETRATRSNRLVETPVAFKAFMEAKNETSKVSTGFQTEYQREFLDWTRNLLIVKPHPGVTPKVGEDMRILAKNGGNGYGGQRRDDREDVRDRSLGNGWDGNGRTEKEPKKSSYALRDRDGSAVASAMVHESNDEPERSVLRGKSRDAYSLSKSKAAVDMADSLVASHKNREEPSIRMNGQQRPTQAPLRGEKNESVRPEQQPRGKPFAEEYRNGGYREYEFEEPDEGYGANVQTIREPVVISAKNARSAGISERSAHRTRERRHFKDEDQDHLRNEYDGLTEGHYQHTEPRPPNTRVLQYRIQPPVTWRLAEDLLRRAKEASGRP